MILDFLAAADGTPLTKTFTKTTDELQTSAYPMVKEFTSTRFDVGSMQDLYDVLKEQAALNRCLLKGQLNKQLVNQSRAGATNANDKTDWLLLDLDFETGFNDIDDFLAQLDPAFKDVDYIFQHSASSGISGRSGLRGHVFIQLTTPALPTTIKEWLKAKNFELSALNSRIELSANGMALKYPLDITTCQNDKLIYISPPTCIGFQDPLDGARFTPKQGKKRTLTLNFVANAAKTAGNVENKVNELRQAAGLKKRTAKYKTIANQEILANPDTALVTDIREARGFVYLNLNGGDSWAYYFPTDNPSILFNFKGEPPVLLRDIAPDVYAAYARNEVTGDAEKDVLPFVFRDRPTDTYYTALWDRTNGSLKLWTATNVQKLQHFMLQYGAIPPDVIEDWTLEFDPTNPKQIDLDNRWINRFVPSKYLKRKEYPETKAIPPVIDKVLRSICVDSETKNYFLNWLAHIFQTRQKVGTAWIFHGVPGTGKGLLFERILQPLFGTDYVKPVLTSNMEDQYNDYMHNALFNWIDEFDAKDGAYMNRIMNKLKNSVTEHHVLIRQMRMNPRQERVFNNIIIATNHSDPVPLDANERRFNIAPAQEQAIQLTIAEIESIANELEQFAGFLHHYEVNLAKTKTVLKNEAREKMIRAAETSVDNFFRAIREGDMDYFLQFLRNKESIMPDVRYMAYKDALKAWLERLTAKSSAQSMAVSRDEMMATYAYLQGTDPTPAKFSRMARIHRVEINTIRLDDEVLRGFYVDMKPENLAQAQRLLEDKPTALKQVK